MSYKACCMGRRHPPSPDGVAPRPAIASPPAFKLNAKSQDLFPASWSSGSRLSKPEDTAAIQAIFEEDKSSSYCNEHDTPTSKRPSSTLSAVKSQLRKHLSKDSGFTNSKRHSRASVGTSEEEVERRAELRRIRHKRIQEELSQEGIYDDDAKSLDTVDAPAAVNKSGVEKRAPWTPGDSLPLPASNLAALPASEQPLSVLDEPTIPELPPSRPPNPESPPSKLQLPPKQIFNQKGPMLEALYYGLMSPQTPTSKEHANLYFTEWSTTLVDTITTRSRRHSSPGVSPQFEIEEPNVYQPIRKRSSLPPMPPAPVIQPQRLPSVVAADSGKSSWRLSFSADNRGDQLRKLSQGVGLSAILDPDKLDDDRQPTRKWLHSQGLRTTSQVVEFSEDASNLECSASHAQTCLSSANFGGVDGGGVDGGVDSVSVLHLHEMDISQRLASRGLQSSCSSPQLSSIGSRTHHRGVSSISGISRARRIQNTTDSLPLSERIPESWGNILENDQFIQDGTSSFYPSANNSIQPSRKSSRFSLFSMLPGIKSKTDLLENHEQSSVLYHHLRQMEPPSIFVAPTSPLIPPGRGLIPIASASCDSLPLPFTGYHRRPTIDTNSTAVSETESFRQRELELNFVRTRFPAAEASRIPSTPRSSKFREEFDHSPLYKEESLPIRPSALSRLAKFAARSFDGPFEKRLGVVMIPMTPAVERGEVLHHHHSKQPKTPLGPISNPLEDGSVLGMWGNAVYLNTNPKAKDVASKLYIPGKKKGQDSRQKSVQDLRKKSHASKESKEKKKKLAMKGLGWGVDKSDSDSEDEGNPEDDWEAELAKVAQKAKGKSRNIVKKKFAEPDRRYPASWSKFSSHDRHERTASADTEDRIRVKDFATDGSELVDHGKKTLREKLQKRIISELEKQNRTQGTHGRRSSMRLSGDLEYPELEVLPLYNASLMSHDEIAEHVEGVLKEEKLDRKAEELDAIFGPPVTKIAPKPEVPSGGATKRSSFENSPKGSGTTKTTRKGNTAAKAEVKTSTEAPPKKGPTARRGPVARKPGEEPPKPKPAPKIAPAVVMPARGRGAGTTISLMDGSMDHGSESSVVAQVNDYDIDDGEISIADPRFYEDCIVNTTPGPDEGLSGHTPSQDLSDQGSRKSKYRTWSGKDWDNFKHSAKNRRSLGTLKLRKSTDEILNELKKAEVTERENALRAAEKAWGV